VRRQYTSMTYHRWLTVARGDFRCLAVSTYCITSHTCVHAGTSVPIGAQGGTRQRHKNAVNIVTFPPYPLAYPITIRNPRLWNEIIRKDCAFVSYAKSNNTSSARGCRFFCFISALAAAYKAVISVWWISPNRKKSVALTGLNRSSRSASHCKPVQLA